jgi:hypothetical protein
VFRFKACQQSDASSHSPDSTNFTNYIALKSTIERFIVIDRMLILQNDCEMCLPKSGIDRVRWVVVINLALPYIIAGARLVEQVK